MQRFDILGVGVDAIGQQALREKIVLAAKALGKTVFAYVNIHALNVAHVNAGFRRFLSDADVVYCDGEGIRLAANLLGFHLPPRIVLTYFLWDLCAVCEMEGLSVFVLGAKEEILQAAVAEMRRRHPSLHIAGWHHGYFAKSGPESDQVVVQVNEVQPNILFVGFGMPLQEEWLQLNKARLRAGAILPCGSMIDYASGRKSPAPRWMADHGMEWVFRLLQEPRRLWKRYLLGNPWFFFRLLNGRVQRRGAK
jgi:N-acetylglucosaminyldiphosphoundecaprenol N-acetyl-beta-D-mannosaminyltransferase